MSVLKHLTFYKRFYYSCSNCEHKINYLRILKSSIKGEVYSKATKGLVIKICKLKVNLS